MPVHVSSKTCVEMPRITFGVEGLFTLGALSIRNGCSVPGARNVVSIEVRQIDRSFTRRTQRDGSRRVVRDRLGETGALASTNVLGEV